MTLIGNANVPPPLGKPRHEFDVDRFETRVQKDDSPLTRAYETAVQMCYSNVLPRPRGELDRPWNRPHQYIAAGCAFVAVSGEGGGGGMGGEEVVGLVERAYEEFKARWREVEAECGMQCP